MKTTTSHFLSQSGTRWIGCISVALALVLYPAVTSAHQNPSGCNANRLNASIIKDRTEVYQGQTITYSVTVSNMDFGSDIACDITNATVQITLPAADGSATGDVVTLTTGANYPGTTPVTMVGSTPYIVDVNPGVTDIVAEVSVSGTLHDAPVDHSAQIIKTVGTSVVAAPTTPSEPSGSGSDDDIDVDFPLLPRTGTAAPRS